MVLSRIGENLGFLGTSTGVVSDLSLIFEIIIIAIITFSWLKAKEKDTNMHHRLMIIAVIVNVVFVVSYMVKSLVEGQTSFQGPENVRVGLYLPVVIVHGLISILVLVLSFVLIYLGIKWGIKDQKWAMNKEKKPKHKKFGKLLFFTWYIALITGIIVYILLYVVYPQP